MTVAAAHAYLGLGANLGNSEENLVTALELISELGNVELVSPLYETEPMGYREQPVFLNAAALLLTDLGPFALLRALKAVETGVGRTASFRNAPRPIDIDILLYDDFVLESEDLTLPHPRLVERAFALAPLADIASNLRHPGLGLTVSQMLRAPSAKGKVERREWRVDSKRRISGLVGGRYRFAEGANA